MKKITIIILIILLAVSITVNIFQLKAQLGVNHVNVTETTIKEEVVKEESIFNLDEVYSINKRIVQDNIEWTEVIMEVKGYGEAFYELWLTHKNEKSTLVEIFNLSTFSTLNWDINKENGISVSYWNGGPEGGTETQIIYDSSGIELARVSQDHPKNWNFIFGTPGSASYKVEYLMDGACKGVYAEEQKEEPIIEIQGLLVSYGRDDKLEYMLPQPFLTKCRLVHDDNFAEPTIKIVDFDENRVTISLPNSTTATISKSYKSYGSPIAPVVDFQ